MISLKFICFLLCFHCISSRDIGNGTRREGEIIGGKDTDISDVPYQVILEFGGEVRCGACLIALDWTISAAHCYAPLSVPDIESQLVIRVGSSYKLRGGDLFKVSKVVIHPEYNNVTNKNDIALAQLDKSIAKDENKAPVAIVGPNVEIPQNTELKISGFGLMEEDGKPSNVLQTAIVKVVNDSYCRNDYAEGVILPSMFCASAESATVCKGDSGGPAVFDKTLVGVIAANWHCERSQHPTVFTKVSPHFYWIKNVTGAKFVENVGR